MLARPLPRPQGSWLTGELSERMRLGADFYGEMARRHGDIARFRLGPWSLVLLSHPNYVAHVLREHPERYSKGELLGSLRVLLGNGLFFSERSQWRSQRRTVQPSFHPKSLASLVPAMQRCIDASLPVFDAAVREGAVLDLHAEMTKITLDIAATTLFGASLRREDRAVIGERTDELSHLIDQRMFSLQQVLPLWVPVALNRKMTAAVGALDSVVYKLIDARTQGTTDEPPGDLLGALLQARDPETGAALSRQEIRDQVMTFFMAGHETTASALSWCLKLLCEHPEAADSVRTEVESLGPNAPLTSETLGALTYTTSTLKEALRLYPPGWTMTRQALEDDVIGDFRIPAGTNLVICPYAMHRDERFWDDPLSFRPERFPLDAKARAAYLPFGAGPRACIGGQFATLEGTLILASLARRYRFTITPGVTITADPLVTLRPKPGVPVTVARA